MKIGHILQRICFIIEMEIRNINTLIIEACKIKDNSDRIKVVTSLLNLKKSENKVDLLINNLKINLKNDGDWIDLLSYN